jgi:SAM-dependent methyltransferase
VTRWSVLTVAARWMLVFFAGASSASAQGVAAPSAQDRGLFPPENLGLLEGPDRAIWQRPDQIMDTLGIADGSKVADVGAGAGYFTIRLARRVGPRGVVYATDVQQEMLDVILRRVAREKLQNVRTSRGDGAAMGLPRGGQLDAILVVDTYPEVKDRVAFLHELSAALKADGRIGIVNYKPGGGGPGPAPSEGVRVPQATVEVDAHAAGLRVRASQNLPYQYLLVLGK